VLIGGHLVKLYRKLHLFDLSLPEMTYTESARFNAGCDLGIFETRKLGMQCELIGSVWQILRRHVGTRRNDLTTAVMICDSLNWPPSPRGAVSL
jgi:hypothetical protein